MRPSSYPGPAFPRSRKPRGFTLIELMIAIAIIGILAAVAYPSFQDSIRKSRRSDAWSLLQNAALAQEKYRTSNASYASAVTSLSGACPTSGSCTSPSGYYTLSIETPTATGFTLVATAAAGTSQASDSGCTAIRLVQSAAAGQTFTPATCWKR